jgi:hypothetical protein
LPCYILHLMPTAIALLYTALDAACCCLATALDAACFALLYTALDIACYCLAILHFATVLLSILQPFAAWYRGGILRPPRGNVSHKAQGSKSEVRYSVRNMYGKRLCFCLNIF